MKKITCMVVEDILPIGKQLVKKIEKHCPQLEVLGLYETVVQALKAIQNTPPQILFLDIEMGQSDGFDLLDLISDKAIIQVIFTTGSKDHAIKAFRYDAVDYLLKPIDPDELIDAVKKAVQNLENKQVKFSASIESDKISLHTQDSIEYVKLEDIMHIEADGNYSCFYLSAGSKIIVSNTLKMFDQMLSEKGFLRVHQSHLVNMNKVRSFLKQDGGYLKLSDNSQIPVSYRKRALVLQMLDQYL